MVDMSSLVGTFRRFGLEGPVYQIVSPAPLGNNGTSYVHIRVIESGEKLDYPVASVLSDPSEV